MNNNEMTMIVSNDLQVKTFIKENNLNSKVLDIYELQFYEHIINREICLNCKGIELCQMQHKGYKSVLSCEFGKVYFETASCDKFTEVKKSLKSSMDFDLKDEIFTTPKRNLVFEEFKKIIDKNADKGVFLTGPFGVGKSFLFRTLAYQLDKNSSVEFVSFPGLLDEIKSSFQSNSTNAIITKLKTVDYLLIDEFSYNAFKNDWVRDEFLYLIFEYRIQNKLITCFTSNYDFEYLSAKFSLDPYSKIDNLKLLERIKMLSNEICLEDKNYRETK